MVTVAQLLLKIKTLNCDNAKILKMSGFFYCLGFGYSFGQG